MPFFIDPALIAETDCDKDFNCLSADRKYLCKVEMRFGDILYVTSHHDEACHFQEKLPTLNKCNCPVRKAIYINYGI